LEKEMKRSK